MIADFPTDAGTIEIPVAPQLAQQSLLHDEAIAQWSRRNRIAEAATVQILRMLSEGKDASKIVDLLTKLQSPDEFTKQLLQKFL